MVLRPVQPVDLAGACEHLDGCPGFTNQGRTLQGALTPADHQHLLARETAEVSVVRRVGGELLGQVSGHLGPVDEWRDAARHHDVVGGDAVAVRQGDDEPPRLLLDAHDAAPVDIGRYCRMHPHAVVDEVVQRNGALDVGSGGFAVARQGQRSHVFRDAGGGPVGPEQHPLRHRSPEVHRLPEGQDLCASSLEVSRCSESVRPSPYDYDLCLIHTRIPIPVGSYPD